MGVGKGLGCASSTADTSLRGKPFKRHPQSKYNVVSSKKQKKTKKCSLFAAKYYFLNQIFGQEPSSGTAWCSSQDFFYGAHTLASLLCSWYLDSCASRPRLACVYLGVSADEAIDLYQGQLYSWVSGGVIGDSERRGSLHGPYRPWLGWNRADLHGRRQVPSFSVKTLKEPAITESRSVQHGHGYSQSPEY